MQKKIFVTFLIFVAMISCTPQEAKKWTRFSSPEGRFTVLMPGQPSLATSSDKSEHSYSVRTKGADYYIEYYDNSGNPKLSAEQMMDIPRTAVMTGQNVKMLSDRRIDFNGYPGRELKFGVYGGEMIHWVRVYVVGDRTYTMMIVAPASMEASAEAEKFFSSFELI